MDSREMPVFRKMLEGVLPLINNMEDHTAAYENAVLSVDGVDITHLVQVREGRNHDIGRFRSSPNGKFRVIVGDYGSRRQHHQKKGEFDLVAIAASMVETAAHQMAKTNKNRLWEHHEGMCDTLFKELTGLERREARGKAKFYISATEDPDRPFQVVFRTPLTSREVRKLHSLANRLGLAEGAE